MQGTGLRNIMTTRFHGADLHNDEDKRPRRNDEHQHKDKKMNRIARATSIAVLVTLGLAPEVFAADETHDWPSFIGPLGTYAAPADTKLIDDMSKAKKVWESEERRMGYGKTLSNGGITPAFRDLPPSGFASPIVRAGLLINAYFCPSGDVIDETWRASDKNQDPSGTRYKVSADDIVIAIDVKTGRTRWKFVSAGKGLSRPMSKRNGWGITPAAGKDKVFAIGTTSLLYALDLTTGKLLWEAELPSHAQCLQIKKDCLAAKRVYGPKHPFAAKGMIVTVGDTVIAPDLMACEMQHPSGIVAFDGATGKKLWAAPDAGGITPAIARVGGKSYVVTANGAGKLRMYDLADGRVAWEHELKVRNLLPPVACGDIILAYEANPKFANQLDKNGLCGYGRLTAFKATTEGVARLWQLDPQFFVGLGGDAGLWPKLAVRDGIVYGWFHGGGGMRVMPDLAGEPEISDLAGDSLPRVVQSEPDSGGMAMIGLADGKLLRDPVPWPYGVLQLWGDRVIGVTDIAHRPLRPEIWQMHSADPKDFRALGGGWTPAHTTTGGYNILLYDVFSDGFLYCRTVEGFNCYDLRKKD